MSKSSKPVLLHSVVVTQQHFKKILKFFQSARRKKGLYFVSEEIAARGGADMVRLRIYRE